ncbi:L,D-transpeptidase family protein [Prosthecobacter sp.]|uniref:L,D-transpeptidase family protein n=1 Tax=Prosthecobacter sp. TaxID=1965333 RepID=UPI001D4DB0D6|nr:L,D-transpeptidase family protein [Prosthecobacter sp.]MCB1276952.1 L,D-transpeptidase family protein [Prosthecobacter sp.]
MTPRLPLLLLALTLSSCTTVKTVGNSGFRYGRQFFTQQVPQAARHVHGRVMGWFGPRDNSFWYADEMTGKPSVVINLGEQMVYLFKGGELAGGSPISSGAEGYDTKPGSYRVIEKDIDHKSSIYGDYEDYEGNVIMQNINNRVDPKPPGTRFEGAKMYYFMRIYGGVGMHKGYLPGYAASHGCIRLPGHMAEKFYSAVPMGTPVEVVP